MFNLLHKTAMTVNETQQRKPRSQWMVVYLNHYFVFLCMKRIKVYHYESWIGSHVTRRGHWSPSQSLLDLWIQFYIAVYQSERSSIFTNMKPLCLASNLFKIHSQMLSFFLVWVKGQWLMNLSSFSNAVNLRDGFEDNELKILIIAA